MLDGPTQLPCRSYNADFRIPAESSYTLCCDFCATTTRLNRAQDESLLNSVPSVKNKQWKPKLLLKMSATAFSLSLMWNSSLSSLMSRQSLPSAIFTVRMHYSRSTPVLELHKKHDGKSALGICTWTQIEPERIWVFGTGEPGCRWDRWPQGTKAKLHPHSCWLHSDVYLLRSLVWLNFIFCRGQEWDGLQSRYAYCNWTGSWQGEYFQLPKKETHFSRSVKNHLESVEFWLARILLWIEHWTEPQNTHCVIPTSCLCFHCALDVICSKHWLLNLTILQQIKGHHEWLHSILPLRHKDNLKRK